MAKKAARKKPALIGTVKLLIDGEEWKQGEYCAAKGKEYGLEGPFVKKMLLAVAEGQDEMEEDPDLSNAKNKSIQDCFSQLKEDYDKHLDAKAEADAEKEAEKAAKLAEKEAIKKKKAARATALSKVVAKTTIAKPMEQLVKESTATALGDKFRVTAGGIQVKKGAKLNDTEWAAAFGQMEKLFDTAGDIREGLALREAQLAKCARDRIGDDWINFFSDQLPAISRIKKYLRIVDTVDAKLLSKVPLSNIRAIVEAKYNKEDEDDNAKRKQEALEAMEEEFTKEGKVTQKRAREIRDGFQLEKKDAFKAPNLIYILVQEDGTVKAIGKESQDELLNNTCVLCIDRKKGQAFPIDDEGEFATPYDISGPTEEDLGYIKSLGTDVDDDDTDDDVEEEEAEDTEAEADDSEEEEEWEEIEESEDGEDWEEEEGDEEEEESDDEDEEWEEEDDEDWE